MFVDIVIAANASGPCSPFGDFTTLMVWRQGHVGFFEFMYLFVPSLMHWMVPQFAWGYRFATR
jgi:Na+/H+ antiporter NhaD/arsenite permease-like protein